MAAQTARIIWFKGVADVCENTGYPVTGDAVPGTVVRHFVVFGPHLRALVAEGAVASNCAADIVSTLHVAVDAVSAVGGAPHPCVREGLVRGVTGYTLRLIVADRTAFTVDLGPVPVASNPPCRGVAFWALHLMAAQAVVVVLRGVAQIAFLINFSLHQTLPMIGSPEHRVILRPGRVETLAVAACTVILSLLCNNVFLLMMALGTAVVKLGGVADPAVAVYYFPAQIFAVRGHPPGDMVQGFGLLIAFDMASGTVLNIHDNSLRMARRTGVHGRQHFVCHDFRSVRYGMALLTADFIFLMPFMVKEHMRSKLHVLSHVRFVFR